MVLTHIPKVMGLAVLLCTGTAAKAGDLVVVVQVLPVNGTPLQVTFDASSHAVGDYAVGFGFAGPERLVFLTPAAADELTEYVTAGSALGEVSYSVRQD